LSEIKEDMAICITFTLGLSAILYLITHNHPYWSGAVLFIVASLSTNKGFTAWQKGEKKTSYVAWPCMAGFFSVAYLVNHNHPYWATGLLLVTVLATISPEPVQKFHRAFVLPAFIFGLGSSIYLIDNNHNFWAILILIIATIITAFIFERHPSRHKSVIVCLLYIICLVATIYLINRDHIYLASLMLIATGIIIGMEIDEAQFLTYTYFAITIPFIFGVLASFFLAIRGNLYWSLIILLVTVLLVSAVTRKAKAQPYFAFALTFIAGFAIPIYLTWIIQPQKAIIETNPDFSPPMQYLLMLSVILLVILLVYAKRKSVSKKVKRTCIFCVNYSAGHVDRRKNYMTCKAGRRLLSKHDSLDGTWVDYSKGTGDFMFGRTDCPDWTNRGTKFYVPPDPWYG